MLSFRRQRLEESSNCSTSLPAWLHLDPPQRGLWALKSPRRRIGEGNWVMIELRSVEDHLELGGRYIEQMDIGELMETRIAIAWRLVLRGIGELGMEEWVRIDTPPLGRLAEGDAGRQV